MRHRRRLPNCLLCDAPPPEDQTQAKLYRGVIGRVFVCATCDALPDAKERRKKALAALEQELEPDLDRMRELFLRLIAIRNPQPARR